jgi:hypothetical protein
MLRQPESRFHHREGGLGGETPDHCCPKQHRTLMGCIEDRGFESGEMAIWD